jgi:hypothetical protein
VTYKSVVSLAKSMMGHSIEHPAERIMAVDGPRQGAVQFVSAASHTSGLLALWEIKESDLEGACPFWKERTGCVDGRHGLATIVSFPTGRASVWEHIRKCRTCTVDSIMGA